MTDMIDGLAEVAKHEAEVIASGLSSRRVAIALQSDIRARLRRKRIINSSLAVAAVAVVAIAGLSIQAALPEPVEPAAPVGLRTVLSSDGSLTVFSDGSMTIVTNEGTVVDFAAPSPEADVPYLALTPDEACGIDVTQLAIGWTYYSPSAQELLYFGRPQVVEADGSRGLTAQGAQLPLGSRGYPLDIAFAVETDPGVADHLGFRQSILSSYVAPGDRPTTVHTFSSALDAKPSVELVGEPGTSGFAGFVEGRKVGAAPTGLCVDYGVASVSLEDVPEWVLYRYLVADVFLLDREGNEILIARHVSWTTTQGGQS